MWPGYNRNAPLLLMMNLWAGRSRRLEAEPNPHPQNHLGVGWFANETTGDKILSQHGHNVGYVINPIVKPCQAWFDCAQSLLHGRQSFKLAVLAEAHFRACAIHANSPLRRSFR